MMWHFNPFLGSNNILQEVEMDTNRFDSIEKNGLGGYFFPRAFTAGGFVLGAFIPGAFIPRGIHPTVPRAIHPIGISPPLG